MSVPKGFSPLEPHLDKQVFCERCGMGVPVRFTDVHLQYFHPKGGRLGQLLRLQSMLAPPPASRYATVPSAGLKAWP